MNKLFIKHVLNLIFLILILKYLNHMILFLNFILNFIKIFVLILSSM